MTWLVPEERWADFFAFETTPELGNGTDGSEVYVQILARFGEGVFFDGEIVEIGDFVPVGTGGEYGIAWLYIDEGIHFIESETAVGVHLWGMGPSLGIAHPVGATLPVPP